MSPTIIIATQLSIATDMYILSLFYNEQDPLRGVICARPSQGCYLCKTLSGVLLVQDPLRGVTCARPSQGCYLCKTLSGVLFV